LLRKKYAVFNVVKSEKNQFEKSLKNLLLIFIDFDKIFERFLAVRQY